VSSLGFKFFNDFEENNFRNGVPSKLFLMQFDSIFDDNRFGYWWYWWWVVKEGEENDG